MNEDKIWISKPHMGGNEMKYVQEAIDTNWVSTVGGNITAFEESLENYLGKGSYVTALNSGTSAIHLGLLLLGVAAGDEVLCQSLTFVASANPILYLGATAVFVDSELTTWNLCPIALEEAIVARIAKGKTPKAIVAVDLYGVPYQKTAVRAIADRYGIPILEDSAEAFGSSYCGDKCGTFGDIGILSFNGSKIITTSGGGALVTRSKELKEKAVFLATQSKDTAPHYQHTEIGYNYRMSNVCAGIGRGQMEVLDEHVSLRRAVHQFYVSLFENCDGISVYAVPQDRYFSNCWLTVILIHPEKAGGLTKEVLRLALLDHNIESRPVMKPLHTQPLFDRYPFYGKGVSQHLFDCGLCLPSSSNLTVSDLERIATVLAPYIG